MLIVKKIHVRCASIKNSKAEDDVGSVIKSLCNNPASGLQPLCSPERVITLLASNSAGYFMKLVFGQKCTSRFANLAFNG